MQPRWCTVSTGREWKPATTYILVLRANVQQSCSSPFCLILPGLIWEWGHLIPAAAVPVPGRLASTRSCDIKGPFRRQCPPMAPKHHLLSFPLFYLPGPSWIIALKRAAKMRPSTRFLYLFSFPFLYSSAVKEKGSLIFKDQASL